MNKVTIIIALVFFNLNIYAQDVIKENRQWRELKNQEFTQQESSPLTTQQRQDFDSLNYYPIKPEYHVVAALELTPDSKLFKMQTSTARMAEYRKYAIATFKLNGKTYHLAVYQSPSLMKTAGYEDYLFIPFSDLTNGDETHGGGRYLEAQIPQDGHTIVLDFNRAYNPYCAYNSLYSCPIPPAENHLDIKIEAGEKKYKDGD